MKKILALALVLMLALAAAAEETVFKVGTNPEFKPFEFIDDEGNIAGIDVAIMNKICEKLGYTVQWEIMSFDALVPSVNTGKIDASIAGMTITDERKESVLFTDPYFDANQAIIVPAENSKVSCEADLDGKKIGVVLGYTGDLYVTDNFANATVERYEKGVDAVMDLANGRLDAVVIDVAPANELVAGYNGKLTVLPDVLSDEQYGIALSLDATELCEKINAILKEMVEDGSMQECIDMYTGANAK